MNENDKTSSSQRLLRSTPTSGPATPCRSGNTWQHPLRSTSSPPPFVEKCSNSPSITDRKCSPVRVVSNIVIDAEKSLLEYTKQLETTLDELLDELTNPTPLPPSPKKQQRDNQDLLSSIDVTKLHNLHNLSTKMMLCQKFFETKEASQSESESESESESDTPSSSDTSADPEIVSTKIKYLKELSNTQRTKLKELCLLIFSNKEGHVPKGIQGRLMSLSLWKEICKSNIAIKNLVAQLHQCILGQAPPPLPASESLLRLEDITNFSPMKEEDSTPSPHPRRSPRKKQPWQSISISPKDKLEILDKTRTLLKEAFPPRDRPYSTRQVQGRMYELVVQLALQKTYGEASVCDTNTVKKNFPVFDLIWKEGSSKWFVSLKCHLSDSATTRGAQINRDKSLSDEKLENCPELLAKAIRQNHQCLQNYLTSPINKKVEQINELFELDFIDSPDCCDQITSRYEDISYEAQKNQLFVVTRSTKKESQKKDRSIAQSLATINFSTQELKEFLQSLSKDITMTMDTGNARETDPPYEPGNTRKVSVKRKLAF